MMTSSESIKIIEAFEEGKTIVELPHDSNNVYYVNKKNDPGYLFDFYSNDYMVYVPSETVPDTQLEILQAYNEGKTIEFYDNGWWPVQKKGYKFDFVHQSYRIQPEETKMTNREWLKENGYWDLYRIITEPIIKCMPKRANGDSEHNILTQVKLILDKEFEENKND